MTTILARAIARGDASVVAEALVSDVRRQLGGAAPVLALVFASSPAQSLSELMPAVKARLGDVLLLGASTAAEFTDQGASRGAAVLVAIAGDFEVRAALGKGLGAGLEQTVAGVVGALPRAIPGYPCCTGILLIDTLTGNGEETTLLTAAMFGGKLLLAGGAAGADLDVDPKHTFVALGDRVESDAMVLALLFSKTPLAVSVRHGHEPITEPMRVTRAEGSTVYEINGRPAWDVWAESTREHGLRWGVDPLELTRAQDFTNYLIRYQAGLDTGDGYKIRTPFFRNDDRSLGFASGVPQGTAFRITESVPERQIESARLAARQARAQVGDRPIAGAIVFDCACRGLILKEDSGKAIEAMSEELGGMPIAGFETYGEIALDVGDMSGFHNTTSVVLVFPRD